ncbi:hypothetical protein Salat_2577000 [Sesamum alatum]|uniref:Uncharacterized protein n=1 Tax=Sesamum alatum TaxID=300844 RepID=A0AAE1XMP9_9LAMI|nr:hypothetical protein Salat_2577000 [Sesamum alatum]
MRAEPPKQGVDFRNLHMYMCICRIPDARLFERGKELQLRMQANSSSDSSKDVADDNTECETKLIARIAPRPDAISRLNFLFGRFPSASFLPLPRSLDSKYSSNSPLHLLSRNLNPVLPESNVQAADKDVNRSLEAAPIDPNLLCRPLELQS